MVFCAKTAIALGCVWHRAITKVAVFACAPRAVEHVSIQQRSQQTACRTMEVGAAVVRSGFSTSHKLLGSTANHGCSVRAVGGAAAAGGDWWRVSRRYAALSRFACTSSLLAVSEALGLNPHADTRRLAIRESKSGQNERSETGAKRWLSGSSQNETVHGSVAPLDSDSGSEGACREWQSTSDARD